MGCDGKGRIKEGSQNRTLNTNASGSMVGIKGKKVRILIITNLFPPQNLGGFGICMERLVETNKGMGYESGLAEPARIR